MKNLFALVFFMIPALLFSQKNPKVDIVEYDLDNGLHVIIYYDVNEPNVVVGTKYHVGSKNEEADRTGFAHFYEHLLFHGTKNIPQGEFENTVMNAGGYCNAYTNYDVTYYYQLLPAHEYKLGLWVESERMLHPVITEAGIDKERGIVKEEKRMRYDNKVLGNSYYDMMGAMFKYETYGHNMIGSMEDLDASSTSDFDGFFKKYYVPNNACLVIAGNVDIPDVKKWVSYYFNDIPKGKDVKRLNDFGEPTGKEKIIEKTEKGLEHSAVSLGYYTAPDTHEDSYTLNVIAAILDGDASYSYYEQDDYKSDTLIDRISATSELWERVGALRIKGKVKEEGNEQYLISRIEEQLERLKTEPVEEFVLQQVINSFEVGYTDFYFHSESLADKITEYYHFYGDASKFNDIIANYKSVTAEDITRVANKYFNTDNRVTIIYHPEI